MKKEEVDINFLKDVAEDYATKIYFLLAKYNLWSEDGDFTFPDGDIWRKNDR